LRVFADVSPRDVLHAQGEMIARAVEDAGSRLHDLRVEEWEDGAVAVAAFVLAIAASTVRPAFALPLFVGGLFVACRAVTAAWRREDLLDRLLDERDAYTLVEVRERAERDATTSNRRTLAREIRWRLEFAETPRIAANADQLVELAGELDDPLLELDPACAVACSRLLTDPVTSPLLNSSLPAEDVRSRVVQIRSGFSSSP
jgi:hypothetical protein